LPEIPLRGATEENIAVEVAKVPGLGARIWSTGMTTTTDPVPVNFVTLPDGARAGRGTAETILRRCTEANTADKTLKLIVGNFGAAAWQVLDRPRWRDLPTLRSSETRTAFISAS
jgi:hypothetical protein